MPYANILGARPIEQGRGIFADGSIVAEAARPTTARTWKWNPSSRPTDRRPPQLFVRYSPDGARLLDTVGVFPAGDPTPSYQSTNDGRTQVMSTIAIPGQRRSSLAIGSDRFCFTEGTIYEIRGWSPAGNLIQIIRLDATPTAFTAEDLAKSRETLLANLTGSALDAAREALSAAAIPTTRAAFRWLMIDDAGRYWTQRSPEPGTDPSSTRAWSTAR
jgi:hypothetical protein